MSQFSSFGLATHLLDALERAGIVTPTEVQAKAILPACEGRDVLATAQTGTGKTFAYLLPLLTHIDADKSRVALILVPTRELAIQVKNSINQLYRAASIRVALLIGGESIYRQIEILNKNPNILVGTPGRILDHIDNQNVSLKRCSFFVLDEVDRMLDMGFNQQLNAIHQHLPETIQTLMFSATMPKTIATLAEKYLSNPDRIAIGSVTQPVINVKQDIIHTESEDQKFEHLVKELESRQGSAIVFVKTKRNADHIARKLKAQSHKTKITVEAIHGDLPQKKRVRIVDQFRREFLSVIVATDIASRGIDVSHVKLVINYDLPLSPEDYVHRIGRTGRAGKEGFAISFVAPSETRQWSNIQRFMDGKQYQPGRSSFSSERSHNRDDRNRRYNSSRSKFRSPRTSDERKFYGERDSNDKKQKQYRDSTFARNRRDQGSDKSSAHNNTYYDDQTSYVPHNRRRKSDSFGNRRHNNTHHRISTTG